MFITRDYLGYNFFLG